MTANESPRVCQCGSKKYVRHDDPTGDRWDICADCGRDWDSPLPPSTTGSGEPRVTVPADGGGEREYRKKPVVITAMRYTGDNLLDVLAFTGKSPRFAEWFATDEEYVAHVRADRNVFKVFTLEGVMEAQVGDYIIRGVKGEHYPCKPDIFAQTYEAVAPPPDASGEWVDDAFLAVEKCVGELIAALPPDLHGSTGWAAELALAKLSRALATPSGADRAASTGTAVAEKAYAWEIIPGGDGRGHILHESELGSHNRAFIHATCKPLFTHPATDARGTEPLTGCCSHCGKAPLIEIGPVNDILNLNVKPTCGCGNVSFNLWPYPSHAGRVPEVSEGKRGELFARIGKELDRAYAKHGRDAWGRHEFFAILKEEVDELWDDIKADAPDESLYKELVQVAAMCFRYYETGDRYRNRAALTATPDASSPESDNAR